MEKQSFQIGWYVLKQDEEFTNNGYECAAWYETILVKAGKYPVYSSGYQYHERNRRYTDELKDTSIGCKLTGVVTASNFSSYFAGNMVGKGKFDQEAGKESSVYLNPYAHSLASTLCEGKETNYELLPEFEAKKVYFEYNGETHHTYKISKVDNSELDTMEQAHATYTRS